MGFDRDDAKRLHQKVTQAIKEEMMSGLAGLNPENQALAAISAVFNYLQGKELGEVGVAVVEMKTIDAFVSHLQDAMDAHPQRFRGGWAENAGEGYVSIDGTATLTELKEALLAAYKV